MMKKFYPSSDEVVTQLGFILGNKRLRERLVGRWESAGKCQGCTHLHLGRTVDHNHCDGGLDRQLGKGCRYYEKPDFRICKRKECPIIDMRIKAEEIVKLSVKKVD